MGSIVLLDDLTINKIAAGEVIERPSSVVKEMVENSIDAGAKNITVEIKNGGISLIKITDDGCGIAKDDMEIAFERHATSKIRSANDLDTVKTMGFRGEALASIAAIARVEMVSKKDDADIANRIVVEGGEVKEFTEDARSTGTTITVSNLFFNTPVRYKFLKKDYTEAGYIEDAVTRIALVNKDVSIKLINNGKTVLSTNGDGDLKTSVYSIYGKDIAVETIPVDYTYEDIKVTGLVGKPVVARGNRANQLFFLNGRYVKDKNFSAAADQAYKGMIPVGRFGFVVLNIEMDPHQVDVNVHPAKLEVRFQDETKAFKCVYSAIKDALTKSEFGTNFAEPIVKEEPAVKEELVVETKVEEDKKEIVEEAVINDANKNVNKEIDVEKVTEVEDKKSSKKSGFFSKIFGEREETEEEIAARNAFEELYNLRKAKETVTDFANDVKDKIEEAKLDEKFENVKETVKEKIEEAKIDEKFETVKETVKEKIEEAKIDEKVEELKKSISEKVEEIKTEINDKKDVKEDEKENVVETTTEKVSSYKSEFKLSDSTKEKLEKAKQRLQADMEKLKENNEDISGDDSFAELNETFKNMMSNFSGKDLSSVKDNTKVEAVIEDSNPDDKIELKEDIAKTAYKDVVPEKEYDRRTNIINGDEVNKKVSLNDTIISSDTREMDVDIVNKLVKEATQKLASTKIESNLSETQKVDINEVEEESTGTQIINTEEVKNNTVQETVVAVNEELKSIPQHTTVIDVNKEEVVEENDEEEDPNSLSSIINPEIPNNEDFYKYAENMIKEKLDIDSTQMIDTAKVRKALQEDNFVDSPEFNQMYKNTFGKETISERKEKEEEEKKQQEEKDKTDATTAFSYANETMNVFTENEEEYPEIQYKYLGVAFNTYIIIEIKNEMYMIDQRAINERIMYEKIKSLYYEVEDKGVEELLLPDVLTLNKKQMTVAKENEFLFNTAGFYFEDFGEDTLKLVAVPGIVEDLNTKQLFLDILEELNTVAVTALDEKEEKFIATIARNSANNIVMDLTEEDAKILIDTLLMLPDPFVFPNGKPLALKMTRTDLEKKFSRRK